MCPHRIVDAVSEATLWGWESLITIDSLTYITLSRGELRAEAY